MTHASSPRTPCPKCMTLYRLDLRTVCELNLHTFKALIKFNELDDARTEATQCQVYATKRSRKMSPQLTVEQATAWCREKFPFGIRATEGNPEQTSHRSGIHTAAKRCGPARAVDLSKMAAHFSAHIKSASTRACWPSLTGFSTFTVAVVTKSLGQHIVRNKSGRTDVLEIRCQYRFDAKLQQPSKLAVLREVRVL